MTEPIDLIRLPFKEFVLGERTAETAVVLITVTHPAMPDPVMLSSDPTSELSLEPLLRGTRSRLLLSESPFSNFARPADFDWVLMTALVPSNRAAGTAAASIIFENVSSRIVDTIRGINHLPTPTDTVVDFFVVMASTPNYVEREWCELRPVSYDFNSSTVTLGVSRETTGAYQWPFVNQTPTTCPGLF